MAYTNIDDPSAHFQIKLYTGNGSDNHAITNDGNSDLEPDVVWIKYRTAGVSHVWYDSSRGATKRLYVDFNGAEGTASTGVKSFDSDGFTLGTLGESNGNTVSFVAWQWHANGGTTSSNTDGYLTSTVQANTDAGFSIVTFTADGSTRTVGHGLGVKPDILLVKSRNVAGGWLFITDLIDGSMDYGRLDTDAAFSTINYDAPTSSVFQYNDNNTNTQVAYCFAQKQGYSKFGTYAGSGNADGPFINTGFKPGLVILKQTSNSGNGWFVFDSERNPVNKSTNKYIRADESGAEGGASKILDMYSNGFKIIHSDSATNGSGHTYIYMAFAENPFVTSTGIPATAR